MENIKYKSLIAFSAFIILFISAYFSIRGISQLFSGQRLIAGVLAGSLEVAKISCTTYLTREWKQTNKLIRIYFVIAVVILIAISSAGIFANLTDAYQVTTFKNQAIDAQSNNLESTELSLKERKKDLQNNIKSADEEISLIRRSIERNDIQVQNLYKQMEQDSTANWIGSIWEFKNQNKKYKEEITKLRQIKESANLEINNINTKLQTVWTNIVEDKTSDARTNVGPLKKLSDLFKTDMDTIAKWFIFVIIVIFDPLGVLLVATFTLMQIQDNNKKKSKKKNFFKKKEKIATTTTTTTTPKVTTIEKGKVDIATY